MDYEFDVFISYSHKDEEWVQETLMPKLEQRGVKVCIDCRDFTAGRPAIINMQDASEKSCHTLLVLTPRWLQSEWTFYESILSRTDDPAGLQRRTIPLLLEKCTPPKFISMLTWVDFTNKNREKQAWENLFKSLQFTSPTPDISMPAAAQAEAQDWKPEILAALADRWANDFAAQIAADHPGAGHDALEYYVDLFVQDKQIAGEQPRPLASLVTVPGLRSIVYGDGGSGKSTGLLKLAVDLARQANTQPDAPVPLFARLNLFDRSQQGLERLLEIAGRAVGLPADEMKSVWQEGKRSLLFLLDGYNEVPPDYRQECAKALQELAQSARHGILITSRPTTLLDSLLAYGFTDSYIVQLTDEQMQDLLGRHKMPDLYDKLTDSLKELGRNPYMLWALAQSCADTGTGELPRNVGELFRNFIDRSIFEQREAAKLPAPTRFHYEWVKKPILSALALKMCRSGLTRLPENIETLKEIRDHLKKIRLEYEDLVEVKAYTLMPETAKPNEFLDEVVANGVLRRTDDALEFVHQSVRDYFAAVALLAEMPESIITNVPVACWEAHENYPFLTNACRAQLYEAIVMCAGLMEKSDPLVTGLKDRDPLLAAECLAAGTVSPSAAAAFREDCLTLLQDPRRESRLLGCSCVAASRTSGDQIVMHIEQLLFSEQEWDKTRSEAIRALGETGTNTLLPTLLRLIGTTLDGTLAFQAVLTITKQVYGRPDYPLAVGMLLWHFQGEDTPLEQREGLQRRKDMYSLYLAGHSPEELVSMVLQPGKSKRALLGAFALLRLLHWPAGVRQFLKIIQERQEAYNLALIFLPQLPANDEVASVLLQVLEDRKTSFDIKIEAAAGLACLALQQDHRLSSSGYTSMQISWSVRDLLVQKALDRKLPAHDRVAATIGLAKGAEHFWLGRLLNRLRDPQEDYAFRILVCTIHPEGLWAIRAHWIQVFELDDIGGRGRGQEFAAGLLERALEDENHDLRAIAGSMIASCSQGILESAYQEILEKLDDQAVSLSSCKAAIQVLGLLPRHDTQLKLVAMIRDKSQPAELVAAAIQSLAYSSDQENALKEFDSLVADMPNNAALLRGRSLCLAALDRKEAALMDAVSALGFSAEDARLHVHLGDLLAANSQWQKAMDSYQRALELDAGCAEAYWGLATTAYQEKDLQQALSAGRKAAQLGLDIPHLHLNLGWYAYENGAFEECIAESQRAAEIDPIEPTSLFNLGLALAAAGNLVEAARSYEAGIDRCYAFPANRSSIQYAIGDLDSLVTSHRELNSLVADIQKPLRECEEHLKG